MKKQYITPNSLCCELEVESLLAGSPNQNNWGTQGGNLDVETIPELDYDDNGDGDGMNE